MTHYFRIKAMWVLKDFRFLFVQYDVVMSQAIKITREATL